MSRFNMPTIAELFFADRITLGEAIKRELLAPRIHSVQLSPKREALAVNPLRSNRHLRRSAQREARNVEQWANYPDARGVQAQFNRLWIGFPLVRSRLFC